MKRRGLPGDLEREAHDAIRAVFLKYYRMKKKHIGYYRIVGIMYDTFRSATRPDDGKEA